MAASMDNLMAYGNSLASRGPKGTIRLRASSLELEVPISRSTWPARGTRLKLATTVFLDFGSME